MKYVLLVLIIGVQCSFLPAKDCKYPQCKKLLFEYIKKDASRSNIISAVESFTPKAALKREVGGDLNPKSVDPVILNSMSKIIIDAANERETLEQKIKDAKKVKIKIRCQDCRGTGQYHASKCVKCFGRGFYMRLAYKYKGKHFFDTGGVYSRRDDVVCRETKKTVADAERRVEAIDDYYVSAENVVMAYLKFSLSGGKPDHQKVLHAFCRGMPSQISNQLSIGDIISNSNDAAKKPDKEIVAAITDAKQVSGKSQLKAEILRAKAGVMDIQEQIAKEQSASQKLRLQANLIDAQERLQKLDAQN